jgi:hypothetical protein
VIECVGLSQAGMVEADPQRSPFKARNG